MSAKYTFAVYETIVGSATQKLILLKLADNANDDGISWPGIEYLSKHCELSRSAVLRNLKALEDKGFISVRRRKSDDGKTNLSNVYKINIPNSGQLLPSSSETLPPSSSELPESNNNKSNNESILSSPDDHSQDVLDIYHSVIDQLNPNWAKAKTFDAARKRLCNQAYNTVKLRANQLGMRPLNVFGNLLEAMAVDSFYSGNPTHQKPDGYRCSIETNLNPKRLKQAIDQLGGDE